MSEYIKRPAKEFRGIIAATFPEYKRHHVMVIPCVSTTIWGLNWSGGSRAEYRACTLAGEATGSLDKYQLLAPWDKKMLEISGSEMPMLPGHVVVKGGHFCGKVAMLYIYCHPSDMPKMLTE